MAFTVALRRLGRVWGIRDFAARTRVRVTPRLKRSWGRAHPERGDISLHPALRRHDHRAAARDLPAVRPGDYHAVDAADLRFGAPLMRGEVKPDPLRWARQRTGLGTHELGRGLGIA